MSIYKEDILPAINNCRDSPNFVEHIEGNNINYTHESNNESNSNESNSNKTQAPIVTAFSSSLYKSIVVYVLDKHDKRVAIYWTAKSLNQKVRKFGLIRNKLQSDRDINLDNIITDYQITSE